MASKEPGEHGGRRADAAGSASRPIPTVTMVGGGQLARMTVGAAIELGQSLRVLAADAGDPAAQVAADVVIGDPDRLADLRTAAEGSNVLTFDHEGVPTALLEQLEAEGVTVAPPPSALRFAQDKLLMRRKMAELGLPQPAFAEVEAVDDVLAFGAEHGWPVVLKAVRGGYDGRGVWMPEAAEAPGIVAEQLAAGTPLMVEAKVALRRELSAMVARSPFGQGAAWPVVETVQRDGQNALVIAPAPALDPELAEQAERLALRVTAELGVVGNLAVELFETGDGELAVNELAMRPHNSGHWTLDGARTSQFEQHLRAVLDYPLGDPSPVAPMTVMANILGAPAAPAMSMDERLHHLFARMPEVRVHLYGKAERPARKIGHLNFVSLDGSPDDPKAAAALRERAELAAHWMSHAHWLDGWDPHGDTDIHAAQAASGREMQ